MKGGHGKEANMKVSTPHQYPIVLSDEQRQRLEEITRNGHAPVKKVRHAQVLLLSDRHRPGGKRSRQQIADLLSMHVNTVDRIRKRMVLEGEAPAIERKVRATPPIPPKLDGQAEAHLVAICCSPPPAGRTRWTMQLLADELKQRRIVTYICAETVRKTLKKTNCSPGVRSAGASPSATRRGSSRRWKMCWTSTPHRTRKMSR
jgi:transposase